MWDMTLEIIIDLLIGFPINNIISTTYPWHVSSVCETRPVCTWDMTYTYVWHHSQLLLSCLNWSTTTYMSRLYVRHGSFVCETWLTHTCDIIANCYCQVFTGLQQSYSWHVSFVCETWCVGVWDLTYAYVWHGSRLTLPCPIWSATHEMRGCYFVCVYRVAQRDKMPDLYRSFSAEEP